MFSSHYDMGVIAETTDRVAVLYAGRMVENGLTEAVISNPRQLYQGADGLNTSHLDHYQMQSKMPGLHLPDGCRFHPRCKVVNCNP